MSKICNELHVSAWSGQQASGHTLKIIPAQFVKPDVKSNKNDMVDAAAIAEAVIRPTMRFVQVRKPEQSAREPCIEYEIAI